MTLDGMYGALRPNALRDDVRSTGQTWTRSVSGDGGWRQYWADDESAA